MGSVIHVSKLMVRASSLLSVPVLVTEQYPSSLGHTVGEIDVGGRNVTVVPKVKFSMCVEEVLQQLESSQTTAVVLFGIETHICVQQTALDLKELGYEVHVLADGVSSIRQCDRLIALNRMRDSGVFVTTSESVLFEMMGTAKFENFKEMLKLIKEDHPDPGLPIL
eukprot:CAMPEP_0174252038 /NCGR_PEP_ID=MMETSP0439-20130205/1679_1 /TAXON_ID=0 /ORGANISM="Stereomyxa ramosa, Strain Chinc5" /LENGTH=165 /DNA_ID=CAMNT_0015332515 /DNA_START=126 /DNA_END=623 /DNA_ORIENTATION=+